jgi:PKD repeat protein
MRLTNLTAGLVAALAGALILSVPSTAAALGVNQSTVVSATPAVYTPDINDGIVYAIGQSGSTVVLGGAFTSVSPHGSSSTMAVQGLVAYSAGTGALVTGFVPTMNGTVQTIIAGPIPNTVYVGGDFSLIDGAKSKLALISTVTGALVPGWKSPSISGGPVNTLVSSGGQLFVGGNFTTVAGTADGGLVVLNPTTGALSTYAVPTFTGHHNFGRLCLPPSTCADGPVGIKSMDINPAGTRMIAVGNFTSVSGVARDQIALIDLTSTAATVDSSWATLAFTAACASRAFDTYMRAVQFSPDGSYFAVATTGGAGSGGNSDGTQITCDAASRFETSGTGTDVRPTWIDYTGKDTFLSIAVTSTAVYAGGHERWVNNSTGSDSAREGAVPRPGIVALDPTNGMPLAWNPGRNPRGDGTYAMLATSDGLYIGSDTDYIGNMAFLHKKNAFFPLVGGAALASNAAGALPGNIVLVGGSGSNTGTARSLQWDGSSTPGATSTLSGVDWSTARGAFEINNEVYYGSTDGNFYERSYDGTTFGPAVAIDPYDDPLWANVDTGSGQTYRGVKSSFYGEVSSLTSMFYSGGRVYYTLSNHSQLFWRWFEPNSGTMGADEFTASGGQNFSHVSGAFLNGSTLYFADSSSHALFQVPFVAGAPSGNPTIANSSMDWTSRGAFIVVPPQGAPNQPPTASFSANCSTLTCSFDASASHDPDGSIASYAWSWGDETTEQDATPTTSHTYAAAGSDLVTLTVTDNSGATSSTSQTINPTSSATIPITFGGVSNVDGNLVTGTLAVPSSTQAGDELLLFESFASPTITASAPAGWTQVGSVVNKNLSTAVFSRSAQAGDAGSNVSVTFSAAVKASLTIADYAGATHVEAQATSADATTASHTSPAVNGLVNGSFAVTFWTDKSTGTTAWTPPAGVTQRSAVFGVGGGAVSALLADSGTAVTGSSYGSLTATTNSVSGSGAAWTIALAGS